MQNISFTNYKKTLRKNATGITLFQYSPEAWKGKQVIVSPDIVEPTYVHERGQSKPSMLVVPENWRMDIPSIEALFHRANIAGGWITVDDAGVLSEFSYEHLQRAKNSLLVS